MFAISWRNSWLFIAGSALWAALIVYLNGIRGSSFIAIPIAPVTTIRIAVSLYLGFKSTSDYNRW